MLGSYAASREMTCTIGTALFEGLIRTLRSDRKVALILRRTKYGVGVFKAWTWSRRTAFKVGLVCPLISKFLERILALRVIASTLIPKNSNQGFLHVQYAASLSTMQRAAFKPLSE